MVIIAGAGISKDSPSNLPSWSEYNSLLFKAINELASREMENNESLFDYESLKKWIPDISISDYIVRGAMGEAYYPLLKLLEGSNPNNNHYALAELASQGKISAIITTNFDTLIEQAFQSEGIPYKLVVSEYDFKTYKEDSICAILKIHGTVTSEKTLIDTVTQKMRGLSIGKRDCLKKLFKNHVVNVLGFSGDDFFFDKEYIPISTAIQEQSVEWIKYPGSKTNKYVAKMAENANFILKEMKLSHYFKELGIKEHLKVEASYVNDESFEDVAYPTIYNAMNTVAFGSLGSLGLCIRLLYDTGNVKQSIKIANNKLEELKTREIEYNGLPVCILLFNIGIVNMREGNYDNSLLALLNEKIILQNNLDLLENEITTEDVYKSTNECSRNLVSVLINIGICYEKRNNKDDLEKAMESFMKAAEEAILTLNNSGTILAQFNLSRCRYLMNADYSSYLSFLSDLSIKARKSGETELLADILFTKIKMHIKIGEYDCAWKTIAEINEIIDILVSFIIERKVRLNESILELLIRRNQLEKCKPILDNISSLLIETDDLELKTNVTTQIIKLTSFSEEFKDVVRRGFIFLHAQNIIDDDQLYESLKIIDKYKKLSNLPVFLDFDTENTPSKEYMNRSLIIHNEYFKQIDKLPHLFYELGSTKELLSQVRIRDLDYSIYMATGRVSCSILRYDSMLRYSSSLAETEDFKLAKEIVLELIESLDIQSEEYKVILGGAYAVLSYLVAEENDENQAQYYYLKAIELLSLYPNELLFARYKRAHSFARKKQFEKSFEILTKEGLSDIISKDEVSEIINTWRNKYK